MTYDFIVLCCFILRSVLRYTDTFPRFRVSKWDKVFKNGPSKICGRQPLKNLKVYGLSEGYHTLSNFLKAVFHIFYLFHS